jgi:tRNA(fMet)-specific endonuclease VapC
MNTVLIDSDILIAVSRGRDTSILRRWENLSASETLIVCSPVTVAEIWHGVRPKEHPIVQALFEVLLCIPVDQEIGRQAGEYLRRYQASHRIELGDALIASTALIHNTALWTRNRRHYPMTEIEFW